MTPFYKRPWWIASAALLTTIVVAWGVASLTGSPDSRSADAATSHLRRPAVPAGVSPRSDSVCGLLAGDQRIPLNPLAAHWDAVGNYQVPGSTKAGPGVIDGHVRRCYAHGPQGAVFAAMNFAALADTYSTDTAMLEELTAPSQARDEALRAGGSPQSDQSLHAQFVGWRVTDYSPHVATVKVAARAVVPVGQSQTVQFGALTFRLEWLDGDWKVVADPDGYSATAIGDLSDFVIDGAPQW